MDQPLLLRRNARLLLDLLLDPTDLDRVSIYIAGSERACRITYFVIGFDLQLYLCNGKYKNKKSVPRCDLFTHREHNAQMKVHPAVLMCIGIHLLLYR